MRILSYARFGLGTLIVGTGVFAGACSSSNSPSTNTTTTSSTSNANTSSAAQNSSSVATGGNAGSTSTGPSGTATSSGTTAPPGDGGAAAGDASLCASSLKDKITTCTTGVDPSCLKGCGPDLAAGSPPPGNLGTKDCLCQTGVYQCQACIYQMPLPGCYQPSATPPACDPTTADKGTCTTPCSGNGTGNDVCTIMSDAGKLEGCVCIQESTGPTWTCATQWW